MYDLSARWRSAGQASAGQIQDWLHSKNPDILSGIGDAIYVECVAAGVNQDLVAAQFDEETDSGKSKIFLDKLNPAGIGAVDDNAYDGAITFKTIRDGIHAQVAHLLTYVLGDRNPLKADDPRYDAWVSSKMGIHPTLGEFGNGVWASDKDYATTVLGRLNEFVTFANLPVQENPFMTDLIIDSHPASAQNYTAGRQGRRINYIILHTTEGGYAGALQELTAAGTQKSSHYLVSADGYTIAKMVDESNAAWTAGNFEYNLQSINIEQEGYAAKGGFTDNLYDTVGALVGQIAKRRGIPLDRAHVIGHKDVPPPSTHTDPGPYYDFTRVINRAKQEISGVQPQNVTPPAPVVVPTPVQPTPEVHTPVEPDEVVFFPDTGHNIQHGFRAYYQAHEDALALFGFPISQEFDMQMPDGKTYTVQYFERARFEYHPENQPPNDILLGLLGTESLDDVKAAHPDALVPVTHG